MFFEFSDACREVSLAKIDPDRLTVGYVGREEADEVCRACDFPLSTAEALQSANLRFRSGVEVYDECTFTELRIINAGADDEDDDCVALYIRGNLFIVVDVEDHDGSTKKKFLSAVTRVSPGAASVEKMIFVFLDALVSGDERYLEDVGMQLASLEADVFEGRANKAFNAELLQLKTLLLRMRNYYEQLLDITEAVEENENEIFDEARLLIVSNLSKKVVRVREDVDSLSSLISHLQDAYSAYLDLQLNRSMKVFTVMTSIFFPLTVIAGWYGMNFNSMPEFTWKYGYVYVIALSALVSAAVILIGKKKKWY